jgi:NAD(P)-dependent dehydrogenase (short-subunit alcohol dehydrogenase family)
VLPVEADVHAGADNEAVVQSVVKQAMDTFGHIDVLINNAQASASGIPLAEHTTEQFDLALYSGLYAAFYYMKACYPYLKETKGSVVNFASRRRTVRQFRPVCLRCGERGDPRIDPRGGNGMGEGRH